MRAVFHPSIAAGAVTAPPSKSIAHRALICGALTSGSTIHNINYSLDVEATLRCLEAMGAFVIRRESSVDIGGLDPFHLQDGLCLDCGESGSTLRLLLPLCLLSDSTVSLIGSSRLMERPLDVYEEICRENGLYFSREENSVTVRGPLYSRSFRVKGDISSQFVSGLLLALTIAPCDCTISIDGTLESAPYIDITRSVLSSFGVNVQCVSNTYTIFEKESLSAIEYTVDGDCSNAANFAAFNVLNGAVHVDGIDAHTPQGDSVYRTYFELLSRGSKCFDVRHCPDLAPILLALGAACGGIRLSGTARLRHKESDRAVAMASELSKMGITVRVGENDVEVMPGVLTAALDALNSHNDHRVVMALSLLCSRVGGIINGAEAVAKSYPAFFSVLQQLGIQVTLEE